MPPIPQQYDASQLDVVQHPTLGELKFPKAMPFDERNSLIDNLLAKQKSVKPQAPAIPASVAPSTKAPDVKALVGAPSNKGLSDRIVDALPDSEKLWEGIGAVGKVLKTPFSKDLGATTFEEMRQATPWLNRPAGSGYLADAPTVLAKAGAGLADFIQTPEGVANLALATLTGGASSPYQVTTYAAIMAGDTAEKTQEAIKNPTPQNVQDAALMGSMTALAAAGGAKEFKGQFGPKPFIPVFRPGTQVRGPLPSAYTEVPAPTPEGQPFLPMEGLEHRSVHANPQSEVLGKQLASSVGELYKGPQQIPDLIAQGNQWVNAELQQKGQLSEAGRRIQQNLMSLDAIADPAKMAKQGKLDFDAKNAPPEKGPSLTGQVKTPVLDKVSEKIPAQELIAPKMPEEGLTPEQSETIQAALSRDQWKREAIAATTGRLPDNPFDAKLDEIGLQQVVRGSMPDAAGLVHFEHPNHPTLSMGLEAGKLLDMTHDEVRDYVATKFENDAKQYDVSPMSSFLNPDGRFDPDRIRSTASDLRGAIEKKAEPISPEVKSKLDVSPAPQEPIAAPVSEDKTQVPTKVEGMRAEETSTPQAILSNHLETLDSLISQQRAHEVGKTGFAASAASNVSKMIAKLGDSLGIQDLAHLAGSLKDKAENLRAQADKIREGNKAHEANMPLREATMLVKRTRFEKQAINIPGEEGLEMTAGTEPEFKTAARDRMARSTGREQIPGRTVNDLVPFDAPEGMERSAMSHQEQEEFDVFQQRRLVEFNKLDAEIGRDFQVASSADKSEVGPLWDNIYSKLKELDDMADDIGRFARKDYDAGNRADVEPTTGPRGEINIHEGFVWTKKAADVALGKNNRLIPSVDDFEKEAQARDGKAKLYDNAALRLAARADAKSNLLQKQLGGSESGVAGPLRPFRPTSIQSAISLTQRDLEASKNFTSQNVRKLAEEAGVPSKRIDNETKAEGNGWLSPDGKLFINAIHETHNDVAKELFPELDRVGSAMKSMLTNGWIRKGVWDGGNHYEILKPTDLNIAHIHMDMIKDGLNGNELYIDFRSPTGTRSIHVDAGWEDLADAVKKDLAAIKYDPAQAGLGGLEVMGRTAGITAGIGIGAKVGAPFGPHGMAIGGTIGGFIGAVSPDLIARPAFKFSAQTMLPFLRATGSRFQDFLDVPKVQANLPDMQEIMVEQQHAMDGMGPSWLDRGRHLPGDFFQKFADRFVFISDKPGITSRWVMDLFGDERGAAFRDARSRIKVDDSPYVTLRLAMGQVNGNVYELQRGFQSIHNDAIKYGGDSHLSALTEYLNLKNYSRVIEIKNEDISNLQQNIQTWQTKLQSPSMTPLQEAALKADINKASSELNFMQKQLAKGAYNPKGFTADKIAQNIDLLKQKLGDNDFNHVTGLADRVYSQVRKVTDDLHRAGIMSDEAYSKYTSRENEYIPMYRIMTDLAQGARGRLEGTASPMYLMHDNVIRTLEGSERTNQNPFVAAGKFALSSYREIMRNKVMQDYVSTGKQESAIGDYFKEVSRDTRPKQGYSITGLYENGIQKTYMVPDWLGQSLEHSPLAARTSLGFVMDWMGKAFKAGATGKNLAFLLPNAASHFMRMAVMSEGGMKVDMLHPVETAGSAARLMGSWLKTIVDGAKNDPSFSEYVRGGAAWSVQQRMINPEHFLDFQNMGWKRRVATGRILDYVQDLNAAWEDSNRLNAFKNMRAQGYSVKAASWETARFGGGPDFAHMGAWMPEINIASMFFNAHLQYLFNDLRRIGENPKRIIPVFAAATTLAMIQAQHNWSQKDEKGEPLMRGVRPYDRDNYFVVLTGRQIPDASTGGLKPEYYRLRKPDYAKFFINPIENTINKMVGREERKGTEIGLNALSSWLPGQYQLEPGHVTSGLARGLISSANPMIRIPAELGMNQTAFGPIVPQREQNVEEQYQVGPTTSPTAVAIGQGGARGATAGGMWGAALGEFIGGHQGAAVGGALGAGVGAIGMSPRRADYIIKGIGGGLSQEATTVTDPFFGGVNQSRPYRGNEQVKSIPFAGPVLGRFVTSGGSYAQEKAQKDFYDGLQKAQTEKATFDLLVKKDPAKAVQYQRQSDGMQFRLGIADELKNRIAAVKQSQEQIQNSQLPQDQKDRLLQTLFEARLQMLKAGARLWTPAPEAHMSNSRGTGNAQQ